jgi:hypothetical protein
MKPYSLVPGLLILFALSAVPVHAQSLADIAKKERERQAKILKKEKVIALNNQSLSVLTGSPAPTPAPTPAPAGVAAATPAPGTPEQAAEAEKKKKNEVGVYLDDQGRGEDYWRKAFTDARTKVDKLEAELLQVGRDNPMSWGGNINTQQNPQTALDPTVEQKHREKTAEIQAKLQQAKQELQNLQDEARRSGALPGWIR